MASINEKGITLIALVITIIVLLVLAGVSLSLVLGDNGVLKKAQNATTETRNAEEKEKIEMAVAAARTAGNGVLTTENLNTELVKVFGENKIVEESNVGRLPKEYQEVEYLESTGTQYIDTKYYAKSNSKVSCKFMYNKLDNDISTPFGVRDTDGTVKQFLISTTKSKDFWIVNGLNNDKISNINPETNTQYIIEITPDNAYLNGEEIYRMNKETSNCPDYSIYLFGRNTRSGFYQPYSLEGRIYYFKVSENEQQIINYIPCYSKTTVTDVNGKQCPAGTKGLYDLVGGKFYTNQNTSGDDFTTGKKIEVSGMSGWNYELDSTRKYIISNDGKVEQLITEEQTSLLPKEYQQVEYIESTGTQYIDTRFNAETGISCKLTAMYREIGKNNSILAAFDKANEKRMYFAHISNPGTFWTLGYGNYYLSDKVPVKDTIYNIDTSLLSNEQKIIINQKTIISKTLSDVYNINLNMYIFAMNKNNNVENYSKSRVYSLKLYKNSILERDYIPCYSTTSVTDVNDKQCTVGTKGLYDLVEGKFYTNQGSGEDFKAGPDI